MYESKKNSGRKDIYKYQKSSHQKNFHNSTHFGYHKYNKYKQKYNHSNSIQDLDEESIFSKVFDDNKSSKKNDLKEIDELTPTPTLKACKTLNENKENFSLNSNINELNTNMKTNDVNDANESNKNDNIDNISSSFSNNSCFNAFSIEDNFNKNDFEIKEEIINEINNNINNLNNINFNNNNDNINNLNNINFNVDNAINDLLQKNNECIFASNEKENIHLEYKKNVYNTPQPFKPNSSSSINLSSNDMKDAFYIPKKLSNIYDTHQPNSFFERRNSFNNFNFMTTIRKPTMSLSNKQLNNYNNLAISNNLNLNYFKNNNNNNFLRFNSGNNNINNNFNIVGSSNININSFNLFDSNTMNNLSNIGNINNINNIPNLQCLNHNNNSHHNMNKNPFHNMMPQFELNQCILKTQINNNNLFEKDKENTDILEINVKISETEKLNFKIRRYDDMFKTVKIFCEINKLDIKLIRPFIIYIIRALNSIYGIYNLNLKTDEIQFLKDIKKNFYNEEEDNNEINEGEKEDKGENNLNNDENRYFDENDSKDEENNSNYDEDA